MTARQGNANARRAAITVWVYTVCFGLPAIPISVYLLQRGQLPWLGDLFPMYGGPWSAVMDAPVLAATLWVFAGLCALVAYGGWLLWAGKRSGAVLVLATLPIEALFWYGYALPFPIMLAVLRVGFVIAAWRGLAGRSS
ncbi:MAG: hypothetical protein KF698_09050 [Anaerolineales bacterium]|nr:hypothetical protein [Anaerolineales bacterium]